MPTDESENLTQQGSAYCVLCGSEVVVENHRVGISGQHGEVGCDSCGAEYNMRLSITKAADKGDYD